MGQLKDKIINLEDAKAVYDKVLENSYKVGDVYETLSTTETASSIAARFGGTWEALPDRKEWNESTAVYGTSGHRVDCILYQNGMVLTRFNGWSGEEITVAEDYRSEAGDQWFNNVGNVVDQQNKQFCFYASGLIGNPTNINNVCLTTTYRTSKAPDRTFKRWKRTA